MRDFDPKAPWVEETKTVKESLFFKVHFSQSVFTLTFGKHARIASTIKTATEVKKKN